MSRFKKGDRIIVDEDDFCGCYKAGDEFEVIHCDGEVVTFIDRNGDKRYLRHDRIQPVPVAEATGTDDSAQADKPKFKVGDRVRYKNPVYGEATVVRLESDGLVVVDTHCDFGICTEAPENIEPVAVAASNSNPEQPLTIQAGRYYRTRDGRKVWPMRHEGWSDGEPWTANNSPRYYTNEGGRVEPQGEASDLIAEWTEEPQQDEPPVAEQRAGSADYSSTAGFTVPVFDEDDFDICGHRDSDDDIVQLSVGELTAALADSLKVARKVGKTIKRGDLVMLARPALVTGIDRYHASVQTDGGNYSLPLAALTAA